MFLFKRMPISQIQLFFGLQTKLTSQAEKDVFEMSIVHSCMQVFCSVGGKMGKLGLPF